MANSRNRLVALIAILILSAGVVAVTVYRRPATSPASRTITIGAVLPLTGDIASYGIAAKRGMDLAVDEINARRAAGAPRVRIIYEDSRGQTGPALSAMEKLVSVNHVQVVVGEAASSVTVALTTIANREKVVLVSPVSSSPELTLGGGPYFFRVAPSDVVQARMMAEWMKEEGHRRVALIFVNNSWGQGLRDEFLSTFRAGGGEVVAVEAVREGDRDLRAQLTRVRAAHPDALYAITYGREGGALLRQTTELALNLPIYGADVWGSPELIQTAREAANGVKIIVPQKFESPGYQRFAAAFRARYGQDPDVYASYSYDLAHQLMNVVAPGRTDDAVRSTLAASVYDGVTGRTQFDANGDVVGKGFQRTTLTYAAAAP
jgi:branched-chain amino acid transport system substrate-binding protein